MTNQSWCILRVFVFVSACADCCETCDAGTTCLSCSDGCGTATANPLVCQRKLPYVTRSLYTINTTYGFVYVTSWIAVQSWCWRRHLISSKGHNSTPYEIKSLEHILIHEYILWKTLSVFEIRQFSSVIEIFLWTTLVAMAMKIWKF